MVAAEAMATDLELRSGAREFALKIEVGQLLSISRVGTSILKV